MPPPLPNQVVSDTQAPPGLLVVSTVPPTTVTFGLSDGGKGGHVPQLPPLSAEAWKNDCPWAMNCWNVWSRMASTIVPNPHEELSCLAWLSVAMRFRMSLPLLPT